MKSTATAMHKSRESPKCDSAADLGFRGSGVIVQVTGQCLTPFISVFSEEGHFLHLFLDDA